MTHTVIIAIKVNKIFFIGACFDFVTKLGGNGLKGDNKFPESCNLFTDYGLMFQECVPCFGGWRWREPE